MERDIKPTYDELESYVENLQKQLADAQATIAALEETILKMGENAAVVAKDAMAAKEQVAALQAQVKELEQWVQDQSTANLETMRHMDEMQSRAMDAEYQLTQRTAELEATKRERDHAKKMEVVQKEVADNQTWHVQQLRAELERVNLLSSHNERRFEEVDKKYKELRTLILALPKVEGAVVVSNGYVKDSTRCHALFGADEDAALYAALLRERQKLC